jgi:hypothetical protein
MPEPVDLGLVESPFSTYMSSTLARLCGEWQLVSKNYEAWSGKTNYSRYE